VQEAPSGSGLKVGRLSLAVARRAVLRLLRIFRRLIVLYEWSRWTFEACVISDN
jgi:hypothetical protein